MASNFSPIYMPKIVSSPKGTNRSTVKYVVEASATVYMGSFMTYIEGTLAAPTGVSGGVQTFGDDDQIMGFVVGMSRKDSNVPIWEDAGRQGTLTNATGDIPVKYAFSASNSTYLEMVEIMPIYPEDILQVALWGDSTIAVARGTTTGSGTMGYGMSVDTTYTFALDETTSSTTLANLDFAVVAPMNKQPQSTKMVYCQCMRAQAAFSSAD